MKDLFEALPAGLRIVDRPEELSVLHTPDCAAAIWRRAPLEGFQAWLDGLDPARLPKGRVIPRPAAVRDALVGLCDGAGMPGCEERARLIGDMAALADIFAGLMEAPYLRLRLGVVTNNACRRFHVDAVKARLVCTYRGTGTQYGSVSGDDEPERVHTLSSCEPIVMRGTLWPEQPQAGFRHRSPPIEGTGETRLVLVLDPMDDPVEAF
jgi:hypothetical protein